MAYPKLVHDILAAYYTDQPNGLPGNDDTGTLSCWALFSMMGFYPDVPGVPEYTLTAPVFDKVVIKLDANFHNGATELVIEGAPSAPNTYIKSIALGGKRLKEAWGNTKSY